MGIWVLHGRLLSFRHLVCICISHCSPSANAHVFIFVITVVVIIAVVIVVAFQIRRKKRRQRELDLESATLPTRRKSKRPVSGIQVADLKKGQVEVSTSKTNDVEEGIISETETESTDNDTKVLFYPIIRQVSCLCFHSPNECRDRLGTAQAQEQSLNHQDQVGQKSRDQRSRPLHLLPQPFYPRRTIITLSIRRRNLQNIIGNGSSLNLSRRVTSPHPLRARTERYPRIS